MKVGWAADGCGDWVGVGKKRQQGADKVSGKEEREGHRLERDWGRRKDSFKCRDVCEHIQKQGEHYSKAHIPNTQLHQ